MAGWLSRSAWSLALVALWRRKLFLGSAPVVWIPDFFCNESLAPLRAVEGKLVFYRLSAAMEPDYEWCRVRAEVEAPDLFVLVHYFGRPSAGARARDFAAAHDAWLVEDAAHVLRPQGGIGGWGDFVLFSPYKHLPIPQGAVLVARNNGPGRVKLDGNPVMGLPDEWASQLHDLQRHLGVTAGMRSTIDAVWLTKRIIQKMIVRRWASAGNPFAEPARRRQFSVRRLGPPEWSGLGRRLLSGIIPHLDGVSRWRRRNQIAWDGMLLARGSGELEGICSAERPSNWDWTPYLSAYHVDGERAEEVYRRWQLAGLPVITWPDLPPEVTAARAEHSYAWNLRHSRLYLPVHQSLKLQGHLRRPLTPHAAGAVPAITLDWDVATPSAWTEWLKEVGRSNLLQTWDYGDAKAGEEGWRVRRGVFYRGTVVVGMVQLLQKRLLPLFTLTRINRGPLFLKDCSIDDQRGAWRELANLGRLRRGRLLSIAPELEMSGSSLALMAYFGLRQFSPRGWESIWVDLREELSALRKTLDGKWRNMLNVSERSGLQLEVGAGTELFEWMIARHTQQMRAKGFRGPSASLLRNLREHGGGEDQLLVLRALHESEPVAGICLARHGLAATYVLGWNGPTGRSLKANQYLLWQAIVHLRELGLRWLDLGGIDEERTPGISAFKLGLNGERYELVGEYWKW